MKNKKTKRALLFDALLVFLTLVISYIDDFAISFLFSFYYLFHFGLIFHSFVSSYSSIHQIKLKNTIPSLIFLAGIPVAFFFALILEEFSFSKAQEKRIEVVEMMRNKQTSVKEGLIKVPEAFGKISLRNEARVEKFRDGSSIVEFVTESGFLSHYQSVVYTNNQERLEMYESWLRHDYSGIKKVKENWYRIYN